MLLVKKAGLISLLVAALVWPLSAALAELSIKGETSHPLHKLVRLSAEGAAEGSAYIWDVSPEDRVDSIAAKGKLVFTAEAGKYVVKVRAIKLNKDGETVIEEARATVTIGGAGAAPARGSKPPEATSTPAPPPAADPVEAAIKAAYKADEAPTKAEDAHALSQLYQIAAKELAEDKALATSGQMVTAVTASQEKLLPKERLAGIREIALGELKKVLPTKGTDALTDDHRKKAGDLFSKLAKIVEALK
jgi:hypothetical protein